MTFKRLIQKISQEKVSNARALEPHLPSAENKTVKIDPKIEADITENQEDLIEQSTKPLVTDVVDKNKKIKKISSMLRKNKIKKKKPESNKITELW